jgi:hypothetical protein
MLGPGAYEAESAQLLVDLTVCIVFLEYVARMAFTGTKEPSWAMILVESPTSGRSQITTQQPICDPIPRTSGNGNGRLGSLDFHSFLAQTWSNDRSSF